MSKIFEVQELPTVKVADCALDSVNSESKWYEISRGWPACIIRSVSLERTNKIDTGEITYNSKKGVHLSHKSSLTDIYTAHFS